MNEHTTERRRPRATDQRPLYTTAQRLQIEQLLGLDERARRHVAFTIQPREGSAQ